MKNFRRLFSTANIPILMIPLLVAPGFADEMKKETSSMDCKPLSRDEERVIVHKGTERAFTGTYWDHHEDGTYRCRRCGAALFDSDTKFDSGSGWPSFDDAIPGSVKEVPDKDGMRTEIVCAQCGGHLGHVFRGEGFTSKNARYCVNSVSLDFVGEDTTNEEAFFAGGCFWGVEYWFEEVDGVIEAQSGYMGGTTEHPKYKEVCSGRSGHAEAVRVSFDPLKVSFEDLARLFFEIHDPTQVNRQGPDIGDQYRSAVYYTSEEQREITERLIGILKEKGFTIATDVEPAGTFWPAEEYHQDYYQRKGSTPYCHFPVKRFDE